MLKLPIENYVLEYFVIPSQTLRISSGLRLRTASAPFLVILSDSEESQQETLRLRLRVTSKKRWQIWGHSERSASGV